MEADGDCSFEVTKDVLNQLPMGNRRAMHELRDIVNIISVGF